MSFVEVENGAVEWVLGSGREITSGRVPVSEIRIVRPEVNNLRTVSILIVAILVTIVVVIPVWSALAHLDPGGSVFSSYLVHLQIFGWVIVPASAFFLLALALARRSRHVVVLVRHTGSDVRLNLRYLAPDARLTAWNLLLSAPLSGGSHAGGAVSKALDPRGQMES